MADPINYGAAFANTPNPFDSFAKGLGLGNAMLAQMDAAQQARAQAEQARILEEARQRVTSGNASAQDRVNYLSMVAPEQSKAMQDAFGQMDKTLLQDANKAALSVATAIDMGDMGVAKQLLETRAQGYLNQGTPESKQQADYINNVLIKGLESNPASVKGHLLDLVAFSPDGKTAIDAYNANKSLPHDLNLTDAQAAKAWADALKAQEGADLTPDAEKAINMATDAVSGGLLLAQQADNLAEAYSKITPPAGFTGSALEYGRRALGGQNNYDALKQEFVRLRNSDVLKNLPPGVASDKDIEIAMKAFPEESANPNQIAQYLRGMAKLQRYSSAVNKAKAEWISQNGNLGPLRRPITVSGEELRRGTSFWDFTKSIPIPNITPLGEGATPTSKETPVSGATPKPAPTQKTVTVDW